MNSIRGRAPAPSNARTRSATNTAAPFSRPTVTDSAGILRAISAARASTRAAISIALNATQISPDLTEFRRRDRVSCKPAATIENYYRYSVIYRDTRVRRVDRDRDQHREQTIDKQLPQPSA